MTIEFISAAELMKTEISERELIANLLETAARILRSNPQGDHDGSAAWRIADAGLMLRREIEFSGWTDVCGVDSPTGMGAILPIEVCG